MSTTHYRMVRVELDAFDSVPPEIRKGDTLFLATVGTDSSGRGYTEATYTPGRTNQSHEEREVGWLGITNEVDRYAIGRAVVAEVVGEVRDTWDYAYAAEIPAYLSLKVRMDDDAPDTFELRAGQDEAGGSPARIGE